MQAAPFFPPEATLARPPALMVGGVRSGCGKTTVTLALLAALRLRNIVVQACKAGPDFIDPAHHAIFTGQPSYNLDAWMGGAEGLERAFAAALAHLNALPVPPPTDNTPPCATVPPLQKMLLIEGVMGLFDGAASPRLSGEGEGSSAEVARRCAVPVLLVLDVRGMAQSAAAVVQGFLRYRSDIFFAGIVCTHVGGPRHQELLREALAHCDAPLLGVLPRAGAPQLPSRHLGLLMPHEVELHAAPLAAWLEAHMDIDALLRILSTASVTQDNKDPRGDSHTAHSDNSTPRTTGTHNPTPQAPCPNNTDTDAPPPPAPTASSTTARAYPPHNAAPRPTIAIAHDAAFCFLYPDFPAVLQQSGAEIIFFSPLRDAVLPPCAALYLPGGYPELYAEQLTANITLRESILAYARNGGTVYGECGGYMYMMESITTASGTWPMTACLPLSCALETQRVALGYRCARPVSTQFWGTTASVRGHEYHYARLLPRQSPPPPLWHVTDAAGTPLPDEGTRLGRLAGSWLHLYPQGARLLINSFIQGLHT